MSEQTTQELFSHIGPLSVLRHDLERATGVTPTAVMLPPEVLLEVEELWGLPVIRGDRYALLYEATRIQPRGIKGHWRTR